MRYLRLFFFAIRSARFSAFVLRGCFFFFFSLCCSLFAMGRETTWKGPRFPEAISGQGRDGPLRGPFASVPVIGRVRGGGLALRA